MNQIEEAESGYMGSVEADCYIGSAVRDVEVLRITGSNVTARGRRYGRLWFIKGLREELRESTAMRRRLLKEFDIHSRLHHPSVVRAIGLEEIEGLGLCIVQEWIDGVTLRDALRVGTSSPEKLHGEVRSLSGDERRRIMRELTGAVAYLHSRGVVHRDLKPSNVMIRDIGREVVLIDFGLSDSDDYVEGKQPAGTPGFISPEQEKSGGADPADDVYSLGVMLREICPRYASVARRCTGPLARRPKDAGDLLRALERLDRRPKIAAGMIGLVCALFLTAFAIHRIISLEKTARSSESLVTELTDSLVTVRERFTDSLLTVRGRLDDAEEKLRRESEYEALRQNSLKQGYRLIDSWLSHYDRNKFAGLPPGDIGKYNEILLALLNDMKTVIDDYCTTLGSTDLSADDIRKLQTDLYSYEAVEISNYQKKWMREETGNR